VDALDKAILSSRVMTMAKCRANRPQGEAINFSHWSGVGSTAASPAQAGILIRMSLVGGGAKVAFRGAGCRLLLNSVPVPASVSVGSEAALIQGALEYPDPRRARIFAFPSGSGCCPGVPQPKTGGGRANAEGRAGDLVSRPASPPDRPATV
jgi:hypothetical protein